MVFGWGCAFATITCGLVAVVDWQHGYGGELGVRGEKAPGMEHGSDGNIPQTCRCTMIANDAIGQNGEGMRLVSKVFAFPLYADAASPVGMIYENEFSPIGMGLFNRREFSCLRSVGVFLGARIGD